MADDVQITNVAPGIRIPVVVENKPNEPIPVVAPNNLPVEVKNITEIRGTVSLASAAILQLRPPAFLVVGKKYELAGPLVGLSGTLVTLDEFPWVKFQPVAAPG